VARAGIVDGTSPRARARVGELRPNANNPIANKAVVAIKTVPTLLIERMIAQDHVPVIIVAVVMVATIDLIITSDEIDRVIAILRLILPRETRVEIIVNLHRSVIGIVEGVCMGAMRDHVIRLLARVMRTEAPRIVPRRIGTAVILNATIGIVPCPRGILTPMIVDTVGVGTIEGAITPAHKAVLRPAVAEFLCVSFLSRRRADITVSIA